MTVHLSFDIDWAPDEVLEDFYQLLQSANVPVTLFHTHQTTAVKKLFSVKNVDHGLHPNFIGSDNEEERLNDALKNVPEAKGVRCHCLYYHSKLLPLFHAKKINYLSNDLQFLHENLSISYDWSGMVRIPIFWEDDVHFRFFDQKWDLSLLKLKAPGLKVVNFHPIHLYLNTSEMSDYQKAKPDLQKGINISQHRRKGKGVRTLFEDLLRSEKNIGCTLFDAAQNFRKTQAFEGRGV